LALGNNLRAIAELVRHDPLAVLGFLLLGASAVLHFHVETKLSDAGIRGRYFNGLNLRAPVEYLRVRREQGWWAWPAYLVWPLLFCGIVLLVVGLFRLPD
jgi:hypothetical protein